MNRSARLSETDREYKGAHDSSIAPSRVHVAFLVALLALSVWVAPLKSAEIVDRPFVGITHITRAESSPRQVSMHIVKVDLDAQGIGFKLTSPGGPLETVRQTTLDFLTQERAQVAINSHFFVPYPSKELNSNLVGLAASNGNVYSAFEAPVQSYALVTHAPALNIDPDNHARIVHHDRIFADGKHVIEDVTLWNTVSGSAQIVTDGAKTIPAYEGVLTPGGGRRKYSSAKSWYDDTNARTSIGLSRDNLTLVLFTVDKAGGSLGLTVGEVADILIEDYGVYNALNLDGGGSTTLAIEDPATNEGAIVNVSSDNPKGRAVASSLAVFAAVK